METKEERKKRLAKEWRLANKEKIKKTKINYRKLNRDNINEKLKLYKKENKEKIIQLNKKFRENNPDYNKKYLEKNPDYHKNYAKNRRKNDPLFKLKDNIRRLIRQRIKEGGYTKKSKTCQILDCPYEEFKLYLESKFESWMSWENYGLYNGEKNYGWDIDHIIPVSFALTEGELIKLNHYTNLQPLCSKVNRNIKRNNLC